LLPLAQLAARATLQRPLIRAQTSAPVHRQHTLNLSMRSGNNVNTNQLAHPSCCCGTGVGCRLYRANVSANENRDIARTNVFFSQQLNICSFHHRVSGFDGANKTFGFHHSECF
jgi:hypothetical protein